MTELARRSVLQSIAAATAIGAAYPAVAFSNCLRAKPDESALQTADLLWTKLPGAPIPYTASEADEGDRISALTFRAGQATALEAFNLKAELTPEHWQAAQTLRAMSYSEFFSTYYDGATPGASVLFSSSTWLVGHIAIVDRTGKDTMIIEAVKPKVQVIPFKDWMEQRNDLAFWQGRVRDLTDDQKMKVVEAASAAVGASYSLFSTSAFDLMDTSNFYCSKLVWASFRKGAGVAIDGNPKSNRAVWLSPKQLLGAESVDILLNSGRYGQC